MKMGGDDLTAVAAARQHLIQMQIDALDEVISVLIQIGRKSRIFIACQHTDARY